jgi:polyphosphate glucokinase
VALTTILGIDVGGTNVKIRVSDGDEIRKIPSGPRLTAEAMVTKVLDRSADWTYERVSIGYPGPVLGGRPVHEPVNLGPGWVGFDFARALRRPVKVVNDATMQALGSYDGGKMLFLGLGTGLGSTIIADGVIEPMELGHLPYRKGTFEDYVGRSGLERHGRKRWRKLVFDVIERFYAALEPSYVVLGGGNARMLTDIPPYARLGDNSCAFTGAFRLWQPLAAPHSTKARRR